MINLKTAPYAIFALRIVTGLLFLVHGLTKLFIFTPAGTAGFFQSLGLPGWLGIVTMFFEIAGGVALILGVKTRAVAMACAALLLGAAVFAHLPNGFGWTNANGGWEYPVMWSLIMLAMAGLGDGAKALLPSSRPK